MSALIRPAAVALLAGLLVAASGSPQELRGANGTSSPAAGAKSARSRDGLLRPLGIDRPPSSAFPPASHHFVKPVHTAVSGPKATNKFWANWIVPGGEHNSVFVMPYALRWLRTMDHTVLQISHGDQFQVYDGASSAISYYFTAYTPGLGIGTLESASGEGFTIVKEGLFGIRAEIRGPPGTARKVTFPIFAGMPYVSAFFEGGFTPKVGPEQGIREVVKVRAGLWTVKANGLDDEYRVYALLPDGSFAAPDVELDLKTGALNQPLHGWIRVAKVLAPGDRGALDTHAPAVLWDMHLSLPSAGLARYTFEKRGDPAIAVLHFAFAHHVQLITARRGAQPQAGHCSFLASTPSIRPTCVEHRLSPSRPPTKGHMQGVVGDSWELLAPDYEEVRAIGFLPPGVVDAERAQFLAQEAISTIEDFEETWRDHIFKGSFYFSGKGFQKVGTVCMLLDRLQPGHAHVRRCVDILVRGFKCLYAPLTVPEGCHGAPAGFFYDEVWGGVPSRAGYADGSCYHSDFGNPCYNDHHYHYGYYVVTAAMMVQLLPELRRDQQFTSFVDTLIRDTTNPSTLDHHFPLFRAFDWFDMHSWSRGLGPSADGKDQESTSEELNLLYGIHLWGQVMGDEPLQQLGATMLAFCANSIREYFLMSEGNPHHHPDFVKNHVTGIFFQNKVHYTTWFGHRIEYIHGIQMLPLSPALLLTRTPEFCAQEWKSILAKLPRPLDDPWTSLLLTGGLAIVEPEEAYRQLLQMGPTHVDDGLTRVWALYWAASIAAMRRGSVASILTEDDMRPTTRQACVQPPSIRDQAELEAAAASAGPLAAAAAALAAATWGSRATPCPPEPPRLNFLEAQHPEGPQS